MILLDYDLSIGSQIGYYTPVYFPSPVPSASLHTHPLPIPSGQPSLGYWAGTRIDTHSSKYIPYSQYCAERIPDYCNPSPSALTHSVPAFRARGTVWN